MRCGAINDEAKGSALDACPCCGVLYTRAVARTVDPPPKAAAPKGSMLQRIAWFGVILGGALGLAQIILTHQEAESGPQQAAGMAIAIAYAVVPYVIARALSALGRK